MDHCSGKRGAGGLVTRRKGYASFKDAATEEDPNAQFCNRIGCHGRIKYSQNAKFGSSDKAKISKSSSRTSNGNEIAGKSTRSTSVVTSAKNSSPDCKRKVCSPLKIDPSESSVSSKSEAPELMSLPSSLTEYPLGSLNSGEIAGTETGSSSVSSNIRPQRIFHHNSSLQNQNTPPASAVPLASRSSHSLKNMKCNSGSGNMPARCSSLESESVGKNKMKRRTSEGEGSFSRRVSKTNAASNVSNSTSGIFISDSNHCSSNSSGEDNSHAASGLPRRSTNENTRTRLSSRQNGRNSSSARQSVTGIPKISDKETPFGVGSCSSSDSRQSILSGVGSSGAASVRTRRSISDNNRLRLSSRQNGRTSLSIRQPDVGISQVPGGRNSVRPFSASGLGSYSLSSNDSDSPSTTLPHDYLYRYNIDGIAEILLALERVEQDELTHEQVLALETSLFLSSLNIYDQHRDMRMDIDNMSYEELLALEERMGTVSTALSEDALSNCLKKTVYQPTPLISQATGSCDDGDDIKCSICQEEYAIGDEIGKLVECQHGYHATCINQWLQMKNWCPICKASAAPAKL